MKKIIFTLSLLLTGMISNAVADHGPYHIRDKHFCTEYELYLAPGNFIYGTEYGCAYLDNRAPSRFIGILSLEKNSFFLVEANPELTTWNFPENNMMIVEYNFFTMIATAYITDGEEFEYYGEWEWTISLH